MDDQRGSVRVRQRILTGAEREFGHRDGEPRDSLVIRRDVPQVTGVTGLLRQWDGSVRRAAVRHPRRVEMGARRAERGFAARIAHSSLVDMDPELGGERSGDRNHRRQALGRNGECGDSKIAATDAAQRDFDRPSPVAGVASARWSSATGSRATRAVNRTRRGERPHDSGSSRDPPALLRGHAASVAPPTTIGRGAQAVPDPRAPEWGRIMSWLRPRNEPRSPYPAAPGVGSAERRTRLARISAAWAAHSSPKAR